MRQLLFLLLPTLTLAFIQVDFRGSVEAGETISRGYTVNGPHRFDEHVITKKGIDFFLIREEHLKNAIEKINGKKPDEVFMTSSTPYGDLHKKKGWKQVHVKIQPLQNQEFIDFRSERVTISKSEPRSLRKDSILREGGDHTNMIYSYWVNTHQIKGHDVTVLIDFNIEGIPTYFNKTFPFGEDCIYTEERYYEGKAIVHLEPDQKATTELEATKEIIKVEIGYEVSLTGDVVAKYNETYKDKNLFRFDIDDLFQIHNTNSEYQMNQWIIFEMLYDIKLHILPIEG